MDSTYVVMNGPHGDAASTCRFLYDCLEELAAWSAAHPTHQPLVLTLGPSRGGAFGMVDTLFHLHELLRAYLGDRLFTPDDLRRDGETVRDALLARGWPAVSALRGRFIVVLNDRGEVRQSYLDDAFGLADDPEDLMFVLADDPGDPYAAFFEYPAITDDVVDEVAGLIAQGFLVRTFVDDPANRARAIAMGAHFLSTRFPDDTLPRDALHGWPVACNPVTAEEGCRPQWFGSE
ncbi:MAG: Ca2+-dependent phosphoinositide-specific phospholipase C [bacterium]